MSEPRRSGFSYYVSDEQLRAYRKLSVAQKLRWLDEMREFSIRTAPPEAKRWWQRLREGK